VRTFAKLLFGTTLLLAAHPAAAILTIEITGGQEGAAPIAVVPFGWNGSAAPPQDIARIIADDLRRSARFDPMARGDMISQPHRRSDVEYADWRLLGVDHLVVGRLIGEPGGTYQVRFQLMDVLKQVQLAGMSFVTDESQLRAVAHRIANTIYEALTGEPGAFDTRIAYVIAFPSGGIPERFEIQVADADGANAVTVASSKQPLMSPAWSPDGARLAYVSFETGKPQIIVQHLATGEHRVVAAHPGLNSAPAWSPDGRRLALTLSRDGNPEIYVLELGNGRLLRLTRSIAIDTEPVWTPDGEDIVFTSDRGGSPQLYQVYNRGGHPVRLTFEGKYNSAAAISPDGERVAMVHREGKAYRIAVMDLSSRALQVITEGRLDESPSFSPNGRILLYATEDGKRGVLAAVATDGRASQRLSLRDGDVREPAWAPSVSAR
jgi:TolB protein